ncbi:MAG: HAMP domain-containing histidine kinase [Acidimicrobiia bacterium]|nr:HAMP domain-containing histidine kinase [Acidimicrobiia bacterium]
MRRRFFWSILAVAGLALFIVALGSTLVARASARERLSESLTERATTIGTALIEGLVDRSSDVAPARLATALTRNGLELVARQDRTLADGHLLRVGILSDDLVFADSVVGDLTWDLAALRAGSDVTSERFTADGRLIASAHPVAIDGFDGKVVVVVGTTQESLRLAPILRDLRVPLIIAAVLAALAARWLSGWLGGRLDEVSGAAGRLAAGDLAARAEVAGDDEVAHLAASFNDMADRLAAASDRERRFLMDVSHELRTPLTTIGGYAEVLQASGDLETGRVGSVLGREAERLRRLIEDVMTLARLEARQFTVRSEVVDIGAHLGEAAEAFDALAMAAEVKLVKDIEPTGLVVTDPDRTSQIVANLLSNALRHTPARGEVSLRVRRIGESMEIVVTDNGPGVDPSELPHLFERFRTGRSHQRPEGSGLGLAIVRQLVDLLGGSVSASLPAAGGLAMHVTLPAAPH